MLFWFVVMNLANTVLFYRIFDGCFGCKNLKVSVVIEKPIKFMFFKAVKSRLFFFCFFFNCFNIVFLWIFIWTTNCFAESSNKKMQNLQLAPKKYFASVNATEEKPFDFLRVLFGTSRSDIQFLLCSILNICTKGCH